MCLCLWKKKNHDAPCQLGCLSYYSQVKRGGFGLADEPLSGCEYILLPGGFGGRAPLSPSQVPGRRAQLGLNIPVCHACLRTATQRDTCRFGSLLVLAVSPASSIFLHRQRRLGIACVSVSPSCVSRAAAIP